MCRRPQQFDLVVTGTDARLAKAAMGKQAMLDLHAGTDDKWLFKVCEQGWQARKGCVHKGCATAGVMRHLRPSLILADMLEIVHYGHLRRPMVEAVLGVMMIKDEDNQEVSHEASESDEDMVRA
eukprot:1156772-Pelagomonas_calceolata.AAC.17